MLQSCSFLQIHIREAKGFLTVVFDLELVFLVELDFAYGRELAGAFAVFIDVENDDAEMIEKHSMHLFSLR